MYNFNQLHFVNHLISLLIISVIQIPNIYHSIAYTPCFKKWWHLGFKKITEVKNKPIIVIFGTQNPEKYHIRW